MQILKIAGSYLAHRPAPQPIIAKVFRDVGQPDTGLSPAVEEITRAVMCRKARAEGHRPASGHSIGMMRPQDHSGFDALRRQRIDTLLGRMAYGPITRVQALELLGMSDGPYWMRIMQVMRDDGLMVAVKASNRTTMTITDAGRAYVAAKVAAE